MDVWNASNGCMERVASTVRASTVRPATATFHTTGHTKWPPPVGEGILSNGSDPSVCRAAYKSLMRGYELRAMAAPATTAGCSDVYAEVGQCNCRYSSTPL